MDAQELTLNIAVNLGRLSRWSLEGKAVRVNQFLKETEEYLDQLDRAPKSKQFSKTFDSFRDKFERLKRNVVLNEVWAEEMLTWANILTHRAKLA